MQKPRTARTRLRRLSLTQTCALVGSMLFLAMGTASAAQFEIKMKNHGADGMMGFDPQLLKIEPGDSVHFVATDKGHDAETIPGMIPDGAKPFTSGIGQDLNVTFTVPGVYGYRCMPHGSLGMVGLVVVGAPVNEAAAKQVSVPGMANRTFAKLFEALDSRRTAAN